MIENSGGYTKKIKTLAISICKRRLSRPKTGALFSKMKHEKSTTVLKERVRARKLINEDAEIVLI